LNYLAVLLAAVAAWMAGAVWYMALAKPWMAAQGTTREAIEASKQGAGAFVPFVLSFIAELVMAWVLAGLIGHLGAGQVTLRNGIVSALFCWVGFVATTMLVNYTFGMRSWMLLVIDAAHWLVVLLLMGAIIGAMGL
jgi:hypothetical protein